MPRTTTDHAHYLHARGPDYVFIVEEDQHRLHGLLQTLPWHEIPAHITTDCGHGRTERRTTQLAPTRALTPLGVHPSTTHKTLPTPLREGGGCLGEGPAAQHFGLRRRFPALPS
ncbi:hypothetical protein AB0383_25860 [Amycolatopsis sp. NPDC051373]|uniref:hypothetical protein n=1 Tax=Amycolatopsis sp. NPDC051373 TaxID=3155801 RepID=UPI00344E1F28